MPEPRSVAEEVDIIFGSQSKQAQAHLLRLDAQAFALAICQMMSAELRWNCTERFMYCSRSRQSIEERRHHFLRVNRTVSL